MAARSPHPIERPFLCSRIPRNLSRDLLAVISLCATGATVEF